MAGLRPISAPKTNPSCPSLCDECRSNPWKYRCPGCSIKSCSLPCVKSHKARTNCTGKRNRTDFVPLSQFDDNVLISGLCPSKFSFPHLILDKRVLFFAGFFIFRLQYAGGDREGCGICAQNGLGHRWISRVPRIQVAKEPPDA